MRLWLPVLFGVLALSGCKKKVTDPIRPDGIVVNLEATLSPVLVTPSSIDTQTPTPAQIVGTGFASGASVTIRNVALVDVRFENENSLRIGIPALPAGMYDVVVENPDGEYGTIYQGLQVGDGARGLTVSRSCSSVVLYFEVNSTGLSDANRSALNAQLSCWSALNQDLQIEGHADERGTTDFNLALGQRRADAVRRYLSQGGVAMHNMTTRSMGEEVPEDRGHSEASWARNRRVVVGAR